ncbi:helix-turn-helix domain-containing protein [Pelagicoccus sp. SDUM812003]|uniref:helix-turn-helix domain-containing protein n=1 Tax=Pelagicoccus sp. SDUM812003 TaxID=3041267 RepID=UPI00280C7409|nr:helix-turn-helix domain-containing protein [Pelagicoccus sp. SDUM812003]MDQ8203863.1 helix-turn-helix domain-containing protein [Pelagicoccus sp. SDUM812003]
MQSIGERLEEARKRKGVTIREAAEATKIRGDYLNSFENNNFTINVPEIYVRGFLRSYCNFLKVNSEKVITDYNASLIGEAKAAKREHREFFGRMELQQPLVSEEPQGATPAEEPKEEPRGEKESKLTSFFDNIEKEVAIKIGIIAAAALLLVIVLVWLFRALTSGGADEGAATTPSNQMVPTQSQTATPSAQPAETKSITLIATGDVRVTVTERSTGRVLLDNHPMFAGQEEPIEIRDSVRIEYNEGANLNVEINGTAYGTNKTGPGYSTIDKSKI